MLAPNTAPRKKVYPRHLRGRYGRVRSGISALLQLLLFAGPWLRWHGEQAILIDLPGRRLFLFDTVFFPQETYFLQLLLVMAACTLFLSSAVAGRMWCGYACPQTLFSHSFLMVERWTEGDRSRRQKLDARPWDSDKIRRKLTKWFLWGCMGTGMGLTISGYFLGMHEILSGSPTPGVLLTVAFFTGLCFFEFGYFREQFCNYLCPYARFQGALLDSHSVIVAYDEERGEPRGRKGDRTGDCVNCSMCVQACPNGIDIRQGLQLECIACAACVDACDSVMQKIGKPSGLIRYTSLQELQHKKTSTVRPRTLVYSVFWLLLAGAGLTLLAHRGPLGLDVVRRGSAPFTRAADGRIGNLYRIHLMNRERVPQQVTLSIDGLPQSELLGTPSSVLVPASSVATLDVMLLHPSSGLKTVQRFRVRANAVEREANFLAPFQP